MDVVFALMLCSGVFLQNAAADIVATGRSAMPCKQAKFKKPRQEWFCCNISLCEQSIQPWIAVAFALQVSSALASDCGAVINIVAATSTSFVWQQGTAEESMLHHTSASASQDSQQQQADGRSSLPDAALGGSDPVAGSPTGTQTALLG